MIQSTTLTRLLATIIVFLCVVGCLAAMLYQIIAGQPLNQILLFVVSTGLGASMKILGVNQGVDLATTTTQSLPGGATK